MEGGIKRQKAVSGTRDAEIKTERKKVRDKEKGQIDKKKDKVTSEEIVF